MKRREAMAGSGAFLLAALGTATVANAKNHEHDHAHMHGNTPNQALIAATSDCVIKSEACLAHCLVLLGEGDKAMAACAKSVSEVLAICGALQSLAAQQSSLLPAMAKVALEACQRCEKECRLHEKKHAPCKACAESCAECAKQCKQLVS